MSFSKADFQELFDDFHGENDGRLYSDFILKKGRNLPDKWQPRLPKYEGEYVPFIYFRKDLGGLKEYCKAFAYQLHTIAKQDPKTINIKVTELKNFIGNFVAGKANADTCLKDAFIVSISEHHNKIRNHFFSGGKTDKSRRSRENSIVLLEFILFLDLFSDANKWAFEFDLAEELPDKLVKYFTNKELETYRLDFNGLIAQSKKPSMSWASLYEMMKFLEGIEPSYAKTATILGVEAGLRISEIRTLRIDCLQPVTTQEKEMVKRHFARLRKEAPIKLDYSNSRWLHYHIIKGKGGDVVPGTPILVGCRVIDAIEELSETTRDLRTESGSNMLFLNRVRDSKRPFRVRSYTSLLNDLAELIEQGMPPVRFHELRATFATILHRLEVPIGMIEKYMNHISSDVTASYIDAQRNESSKIMTKLLDESIGGTKDDEQLAALQAELISLVATREFMGLSHNSRISLFERLMNKFNIKLGISDHGVCVLPQGDICPHGFEGVLPCHASSCEKFHPDLDSEDFFVALLENNQERLKEIENMVAIHESMEVNIDMLETATQSIGNIVKMIKGAA